MPQSALTVGVGAALVDLLLEESDAFVSALGSAKGGMTLVERDHIESALKATSTQAKIVPGGSACNTLVGIGQLGGRARMIGRLGRDNLGEAFAQGLKKAGVEARLQASEEATGRVLSVVTPDAQRTMFTFLGAAAALQPSDVKQEDIRGAALVHLEGYLLFNRPVVDRILELAKQEQVPICLDLAAFQVVEAMRSFLDEMFAKGQIDILIANEDEARAYTGLGESESLEIFSQKAKTAVVKRGARGVLVAQGKQRIEAAAQKVKAIDTTGAGDLWASGFLFGLNHHLGLEGAARLGCQVGAEVVQVMGAVIPEAGWKRIHDFRDSIKST
jgi:sugar/nucleoside kinase (ribokinase family)